jgi:hypothetical protein
MISRFLMFVACLGLSATLLAQTGHPAKGSWSGDLDGETRVRLLIDAWNGELSGAVNPGRRGVDFTSAELDADTWTLTITAPMPEGELVLKGTLSNLGSWTNRKYIGTYTQAGKTGNFEFTLN